MSSYSVPEAEVASVRRGTRVRFRVPAYPEKTFSGAVSRVHQSLDPKTRTMAVELDVANPRNELSPGMYPQIDWPARSGSMRSSCRRHRGRNNNRAHVCCPCWFRWTRRVGERTTRGPAGEMVEVLGALSPATWSYGAAAMKFARALGCRCGRRVRRTRT